MRIGFVGAGKVGFTLGKYMVEHDVTVSGYYSQTAASAKEAALFTHTKYYETLKELISESDAIFLTVPDGAIEEVWNSLTQFSLTGKYICHCSGAMSSAVFSLIDQMGAFGYSIHPLFAIHSKTQSYKELKQAFFTLEGHPDHLDDWKTLLESMGNTVCIIDRSQKSLYHLAAVYSSNCVVALYDIGVSLLEQCGFPKDAASTALSSLFLNNAASIVKNGTTNALTGPVERCDQETIAKHFAVIPDDQKMLYALLCKELIGIAKRKNPQKSYSALLHLLQEQTD